MIRNEHQVFKYHFKYQIEDTQSLVFRLFKICGIFFYSKHSCYWIMLWVLSTVANQSRSFSGEANKVHGTSSEMTCEKWSALHHSGNAVDRDR